VNEREPWVGVGTAFESLPKPSADHAYQNHSKPRQQDSTTERMREADWGEPLHESWSEKVRLDPREPTPVLKAGKRPNYHFGHPHEPRKLTVRERARLQSFPDWFTFCGGVVAGRTQTGNAVPVDLATSIAEVLP